MTALDSRSQADEQPLFTEALTLQLAQTAARLDQARQQGDELLVEIYLAELDDLRAVAARQDLDVSGLWTR